MLKVVGASWEQTRISSYIIVAFMLFGLLIIIFGGSVSHYDEDGNFAASVFWKKEIGYRFEFWGQGNNLPEVPLGAARGYYRQDVANVGWSQMEIQTNPDCPDYVQAYSAGLLEGALSWQLIYWRWRNTIGDVCDNQQGACDDIKTRLSAWEERMKAKAEELDKLEPFWHHVHLFFFQLDGLVNGWNYGVKRARYHYEIDDIDFLWLNLLATDVPLPDIPNIVPRTPSLTSSLIKIHQVNNSAQILAAQTSANTYRDMLRVVKRYVFHFHLTSADGSGFVPGTVIEFTGYPGTISSQDDLYSITSKHFYRHSLLVMGSTIGYGISGLKESRRTKKRRHLEERVAGSIRSLIASRLARDGRTWAAHFNRGRGGASVDKQWQIVDISKIDNPESDGILWIVEQSKGVILASDKTENFQRNTYWACNGLPYHREIRLTMNLPTDYNDDALYSYKNSVRSKVFETCRENCTSRDEIFNLMRNGVPASEDLVGARGDLYKETPVPFGVVDTKIITISRQKPSVFDITSGPVYILNATSNENDPSWLIHPFQWTTSPFFSVHHVGHPDIWSFPSIEPIWAPY